MDFIVYLTALAGFFLGMLVWSRVLRWVFSLVAVSQEQQPDPKHRSRWRLVPVILLNSGPWTLIAFTGFAIYILPRPHDPTWDGFFWGALASLVFTSFYMTLMLRRFRRRRAQRIAESQKTT